MTTFRIKVPAKINLHLQVLGRRPDGFHELRTLFQSVDLFDELEGEDAESGVLDLSVIPAGMVTAGENNLVIRAARALAVHADVDCGARLLLRKGIPVGGGLGGGSADAAATLVLLNEMWDLHLPVKDLIRIGARLGSDVPFFLFGGLCLGIGRGEEIYPLPNLDELSVVIVMPEVHVSTPEVFGRLEEGLTWSEPEARVWSFASGLKDQPPWEAMTNDLESTVRAGWPKINDVIDRVLSSPALRAGLTGSGGAVFALFQDRGAAASLTTGLIGEQWRVHTGITLDRAQATLRVEKCEQKNCM